MASSEEKNDSAPEKELLDIPSDFFDDFSTKEFLDGLSVIDSWDEERSGNQTRGNIRQERTDSEHASCNSGDKETFDKNKKNAESSAHKSDMEVPSSLTYHGQEMGSNVTDIDQYIKPGSRRDPNKTNMAIKKDKEVKVKEYLAKALESSDDIRPPGTELDDYYDNFKVISEKQKQEPVVVDSCKTNSELRKMEIKLDSPIRQNQSPWHNRRRSSERYSNHPYRRSPARRKSRSPNWKSPIRRWSPNRRRSSNRWKSPDKRKTDDRRRSSDRRRSPFRRRSPDSRRPSHSQDWKLLQAEPSGYQAVSSGFNPYYGSPGAYNQYTGYQYPNPSISSYPPDYRNHYEYGSVPQPNYVPAAALGQSYPPTASVATPAVVIAAAPAPLPAPAAPAALTPATHGKPTRAHDTLEQLLIDGKITKQEYLKLTPTASKVTNNPTVTAEVLDKVNVLARCQDAVNKLAKLHLPHRLVLHASSKSLISKKNTQKTHSPLKSQGSTEFQFTSANCAAVEKQNKQLVDSIVATMGLDKVVKRPERNAARRWRHVAVQTSRPYCDLCDIRESTRFRSVGTSPEEPPAPPPPAMPALQVSEELLRKAAAIFSKPAAPAPAASLSHLTPAQLIQQHGGGELDDADATPHFYRHNYSRRPYGDDARAPSRYPYNYHYKY